MEIIGFPAPNGVFFSRTKNKDEMPAGSSLPRPCGLAFVMVVSCLSRVCGATLARLCLYVLINRSSLDDWMIDR
jgi:hypothetical protein